MKQRARITVWLLLGLIIVMVRMPSASEAKTTTRVSVSSAGVAGNGGSRDPELSSDGRFVAFESGASNLVPGDTNSASDIFVHDRQSGTTTRVSVSSTGIQGNRISRVPALSADGRFVAFFPLPLTWYLAIPISTGILSSTTGRRVPPHG